MGLGERITEDMKQAMKSQDKLRLSVLRMVRASIRNAEIDQKTTLSDEEVTAVIQRELKQRRDALATFEQAGRDDLAAEARGEINVLITYLPQQLSSDELRVVVQSAIEEVGATSKADMGKVMSVLMPKVKGVADGKAVNQMVAELLAAR